jgi:cytochrome c-type biogenesis protein CcmE
LTKSWLRNQKHELKWAVLSKPDRLSLIYGSRPDLFKAGIEVIVEGRLNGDIFVADIVQTKCASRYEGDLREETTDTGDAL